MTRTVSLPDLFESAFQPVEEAVRSGRIPGAVLGVVDADGTRLTRAIGKAQVIPSARPMTTETWFDLASLTKVIFTTRRILELSEAGEIDLDAPLTTLLPDLCQYDMTAWQRKVTFRQCLGHQTPFPAVEPVYTYGSDPARLRAFVLQRDWRTGPPVYSDINFILLGIVLERLAGARIRDLDPGQGFAWSAPEAASAATEYCHWRERFLVGEVHDENCSALQGTGHAGLFGTVDAVLGFAHDRLVGDRTGDPVTRLMRQPLSPTRTHGWERPYPGWSGGDRANASVIGHTGFTGTGLWIDFFTGRAITLLTNRVHPSRHFDSGIMTLRRAVGDRFFCNEEQS